MAERDTRADDAPGPPPERDPNALAAWRRVAEQRRRRTEQSGPADRLRAGPTGERVGAALPGSETAGPEQAGRRGDGAPDGGSGWSRHDLLLAMAGRIDDDALGAVRELAPVDDAAAAELLSGCLLADRVAVTDDERAYLERWFAGARVDPDLLEALPADGDAPARSHHRFLPDLPGVPTGDGESVARAAARLSGVAHVRQCWRVTPAGGSPGPLPHRVVLVETDSPDDREHVARHVGHAAATLGAVSVEVYASGAPLPAYQRDAATAARALSRPALPAGSTPPARPVGPTRARPASGEAAGPDSSDARLPVRRRPGAEAAMFAPLVARGGDAEARSAPVDQAATTSGPTISGPRGVPSDERAEVIDEPGRLDDLDPAERDDPEDLEDRRDTEGWRTVADADRGVAAAGWSMRAPLGPDDPAERVDPPGDDEDTDRAGQEAIADLDPDAAAARIAALWREPSAVDAFDAPLDPDAHGPNLLEPDLPEPDLARELDPYRRAGPLTPRPVTGSFERVESDPPPRTTGRHGSDAQPDDESRDVVDREARTDGVPAPDLDPTPEDQRADRGRIRRARHSRSGPDDEPERPVEHDARFGAATPTPWSPGGDSVLASPVDLGPPPPPPTPRQDPGPAGVTARGAEPPTGPVAVGGPGAGGRTPPAGTEPADPSRHSTPTGEWNPDTNDAVNSQLSDRERDLLARLHAELAARERLESGEPDPFAARGHHGGPGPGGSPRNGQGLPDSPTSPSPRPSPAPRSPGAGPAPSNGQHHGPTNGHAHDPIDGSGPRNGRALGREGPDPGDDGR